MLPTLPAPDPARSYLTKADAARWINVSPRTLNRWIHEGLIPSTKIGGEVRIDPLSMSAALLAATTGRVPDKALTEARAYLAAGSQTALDDLRKQVSGLEQRVKAWEQEAA